MKKYFCDVCGIELPDGEKTLLAPPGSAGDLCGLEDLCPRCDGLVRGLDVSGLVMAELRRLIEAESEEPTPPTPAPALKGKEAKEKREILAAVERYRWKNGPGSLTTLARRARVSEVDLREIIMRGQVPLATWRAVGKALGVTGAAEETE